LTNQNRYSELFNKKGFFVIENLLKKNFIKKILKEIYEAKNTDKFFDSKDNLRRIEKLYNKGKTLKTLNKNILLVLNKIFNEKFIIFKDKFNAKPPGGDGFFPHFDGVFQFVNQKNVKKDGWYEYSDFFINVLIALDECNKKNGSIELSKSHKGNFNDLLKKTKNNGTPALNKNTLYKTKFNLINLKIGDVVFFSNTCPHQSKKNETNKNRRILYYTYTKAKYKSKYSQYYRDKKGSKNKLKALEEK
jgi:2-aminoethylphosphonate dioxygenase|tara:strand:- start:5007 stop:5747 length:741 start_codon:yes stop_codon:yes gene_type:complete